MDNKKLGFILLGISIIFLVILIVFKLQLNKLTDVITEQTNGSCYLETGECIHEQSQIPIYLGILIMASTLTLSFYLIFFEKSQKHILSTLEKQKQIQSEEEKFEILLKGLNEEEKKIIQAIKEQDGITQSTLRFRTDLHKSKLSLVLDNLEKKNLIKRVQKGKTKEVYLKFRL